MTLAIFDMDETLISRDCCSEWAKFMLDEKIIDDETFLQDEEKFMDAYYAGALDMKAYVEFLLGPLEGWKLDEMDVLSQRYCEERMTDAPYSDAETCVQDHIKKGHIPIVISASPAFIVRPIAAQIGITHVIGIELSQKNGTFSGSTTGTLSFQAGKVTRLEEWMVENEQTLDGSYFYSDSHNDLPLLAKVSHPKAVNPDVSLREHARLKGWDILHWR